MYICQDASILCKAQKATHIERKMFIVFLFCSSKVFEKFSSSNFVLSLCIARLWLVFFCHKGELYFLVLEVAR